MGDVLIHLLTHMLLFSSHLAMLAIKEIMIGTTSSAISYQRIYTPNAGTAEMLLHIMGKFTMGELKSSL